MIITLATKTPMEIKKVQYRYTIGGEPFRFCPECGEDLTIPGGILIQLSVGGAVQEVPSYLDDEGFLGDTDDNAVDKGFHSATCCGGCGDMLIDMKGVVED